MLKSFKIYTCTNGSLGLHLSRAPWDPYPWVSSIQKESTAYAAGLRVGDCLLEMNGNDVLGLKISDIAGLLKNHWLNESSNHVNVMIWRNKTKDMTLGGTDADADDDEDEENNAHNINQQSLQKFATCLQHIAQLLECPVCLEVIKPPGWQCCNGHVLCNNCRSRSEKCPVCRVPLGPRGRCLLSDKLFTLLAESFPCDGVRINKNSPKDKRKCSSEFHNQPKMAIVQHNEDNNDKAKNLKKTEQDFILKSLRVGGRRRTKSKKEEEIENGQQIQHDQQRNNQSSLQGILNAVVEIKSNDYNNNNRKSSQDYRNGAADTVAIETTRQCSYASSTTLSLDNNELFNGYNGLQCHCRMCYKPMEKNVAIVNNAMAGNKYIFRIQAFEENLENVYQMYQCPTGKLCCCLQREQNVTPVQAAKTVEAQLQQQMLKQKGNLFSNIKGISHKTLRNEWEILAHLTQDHQLAVNQYYAEYGQRIAINHDVLHSKNVISINIRGQGQPTNTPTVDKFFVAFVPMSEEQSQQQHRHQQHQTTTTSMAATQSSTTKVAVFIWYMNALPRSCGLDNHSASSESTTKITTTSSPGNASDEVSNFDAIIENPKTGIKWFGRAHCLTTPWSQIHHKQHFLMHEVMEDGEQTRDASDAFVIVIKEKS